MHKLTECEDYHNLNHILHTDNCYTSLEMCELARARKFHCLGTCKVNRKGLPREGIFPKKGAGKQPRESVKCMRRLGVDIYFTAWQDNKPVHMLSTIKPKLQNIRRKTATLGWKRAEIPSHSLIPDHNFGMRGTDRMEKLNSYYSFNHKGIRWTHRIFSHFLGVSVVNANIVYNASNPHKRFSSADYFNEVIISLADLDKTQLFDELVPKTTVHHSLEPVARCKPSAPVEADGLAPSQADESEVQGLGFHRYRSSNLEKKSERLEGIHVPILVENKKRRKCVFHPKDKTRYECNTCKVPLCLSDCQEDSCWFKFHYVEAWGEK